MNSQYRQRQGRCQCGVPGSPYSSMTASELQNLPLAMAYVPWQEWKEIYDMKRALMRGTIFAQLDLPFGGAL